MMHRLPLFTAAAAVLCVSPLQAGVFGGVVKSISVKDGTIVVASTVGTSQKTIQVLKATRISVNDQPAKLSDLSPGARVVATTKATGDVVRIQAKRESAGKTSAGTTTEWHQFRGPNRDNSSTETGLLKKWPAKGPKLLWTARDIGEGYSTVSLSKGLLYTMGNRDGSEWIIALDLKTGKQRWAAKNGRAYRQGRGNGPRGTPTVDGDRVYGLGGSGNLSCVSAKDGKIVWQLNILKEFGGRNISWGISESVLIDGEKLICTPGGRGATVVALDKTTGKTIWKSAVERNPRAGYASPIVATFGGVRQYVVFTSGGVAGVRANDGLAMWLERGSSNFIANCATPLLYKGHVFSGSAYGKGAALVKLTSKSGKTTAEQVYHTRDMKNHHGGMVIVGDYLYGSNSGILTCLEVATGNVKWRQRSGKGAVTFADGHIYFRSEAGPVTLLEATPTAFKEISQFTQPNRSRYNAWAHPVIADGKLFLRDMDVLLCYDVKAK